MGFFGNIKELVTGGAVVQSSHCNNVIVSNNEHKLTDEETKLLRLFHSLNVKFSFYI